MIGAKDYAIIWSLADNGQNKHLTNYVNIWNTLTLTFNEILFYSWERSSNRTINLYVSTLRKIPDWECNFGDQINEYLMDRLIVGVGGYKKSQQFLPSRKTLLLEKAFREISVTTEFTTKFSNDIKNARPARQWIWKFYWNFTRETLKLLLWKH